LTRFSANLGFLWTDLPLPDAIRAAKRAGFDAVECHWPYDVETSLIKAALEETGLPMLGLNTARGNVAGGENGLSALPGREADARAAIDDALGYARAIGAQAVHVMAGFAQGAEAWAVFEQNLRYACTQASDITLLIEPLNPHDAPGYLLSKTDQARAVIEAVGAPNLKLMFDCYHVGRSEGDVLTRLKTLLPLIGHIQFASIPDRGPPDQGEIAYPWLFKQIEALGWTRALGAEYKPKLDTEESLGWLKALRF